MPFALARRLWVILPGLVLMMDVTAAGWDLISAHPYEAEERSFTSSQAHRFTLRFNDKVLAWTEHPWNEPLSATDSRVTFAALDLARSGNFNTSGSDPIPWSAPAEGPDVNGKYLVWAYLGNATRDPGGLVLGGEVYAMNLTTREVRRLGGDATAHATWPHLYDDFVVWSSFPPAGDARRMDQVDAARYRVHRVDLRTWAEESWPRPIHSQAYHPQCDFHVWATASDLLVSYAHNCATEEAGPGGLYRWDPSTGLLRRIATDAVPVLNFDEDRIAWSGRFAGNSTMYIHNLTTDLTTRATLLPGDYSDPILSRNLVAWADFRSRATRQYGLQGPTKLLPTVYFKDIRSANEYQLNQTFDFESGPVLEGTTLAYNDKDGRLRLLELPSEGKLLVARAVPQLITPASTRIQPTTPGAATAPVEQSVNLTLQAGVPLRVQAWDLDLDGDFELQGTLQVRFDPVTEKPEREVAAAQAVDEAGLHAVVTVDLVEQVQVALRAPVEGATNSGTPTGGPAETPGPPLGWLFVALWAGASWPGLRARRRGGLRGSEGSRTK